MENTDKAWDKIFRFVQLVKHTKYNTVYSVKQTIQKRTVFEKKFATELFVNGKNTVAVSTLNQLKGHGIDLSWQYFTPQVGQNLLYSGKAQI